LRANYLNLVAKKFHTETQNLKKQYQRLSSSSEMKKTRKKSLALKILLHVFKKNYEVFVKEYLFLSTHKREKIREGIAGLMVKNEVEIDEFNYILSLLHKEYLRLKDEMSVATVDEFDQLHRLVEGVGWLLKLLIECKNELLSLSKCLNDPLLSEGTIENRVSNSVFQFQKGTPSQKRAS